MDNSTKRGSTKRERAALNLEASSRLLGESLSLLGGPTRQKPKQFPPPLEYTCRQYIESLITRLRVVQGLMRTGDRDMLLSVAPTGRTEPLIGKLGKIEIEELYDKDRDSTLLDG